MYHLWRQLQNHQSISQKLQRVWKRTDFLLSRMSHWLHKQTANYRWNFVCLKMDHRSKVRFFIVEHYFRVLFTLNQKMWSSFRSRKLVCVKSYELFCWEEMWQWLLSRQFFLLAKSLLLSKKNLLWMWWVVKEMPVALAFWNSDPKWLPAFQLWPNP